MSNATEDEPTFLTALDIAKARGAKANEDGAMTMGAVCPHRPDVGPGSRAEIKAEEPATFARIVEFDAAIRDGYGGMRAKCFLSPLRVPVEDALRSAESQPSLFGPVCGKESGRCFT